MLCCDRTKKPCGTETRKVGATEICCISCLSYSIQILTEERDEARRSYVSISKATWIGEDPPNPTSWEVAKELYDESIASYLYPEEEPTEKPWPSHAFRE